ncbi:MAG: hypothetical protein ACOY4O_16700 [Pseudomonadota bacterium]
MKLLSFLAEFSVVLVSLTVAVVTILLNIIIWLLPLMIRGLVSLVRALVRAAPSNKTIHKAQLSSDRRRPTNARRHWR